VIHIPNGLVQDIPRARISTVVVDGLGRIRNRIRNQVVRLEYTCESRCNRCVTHYPSKKHLPPHHLRIQGPRNNVAQVDREVHFQEGVRNGKAGMERIGRLVFVLQKWKLLLPDIEWSRKYGDGGNLT